MNNLFSLLSFFMVLFLGSLQASSQTTLQRTARGGYIVTIPALNAQNCSAPARNIAIERPPIGTFSDGVIFVKTRERHNLTIDNKSIQRTSIANQIAALLPTNITAPYRHFAESSKQQTLLASSVTTTGVDRIFQIHYAASVEPFDACLELMKNPDIEYATPVFARYTSLRPNDPQFSSQYTMQRLSMEGAWDITTGNANVLIAIIDSGTDFEHPDLANKIWINPGETGTDSQGRNKQTNGVDDDKNGKIDDYRGWDFVGDVTAQQIQTGQWKEDNDPKVRLPMSAETDHGTNVAGCAAAQTNNGLGVAGTGYMCRYIPIKCGADNAQLGRSVFRGYDAILYAADLRAHVINCSWGGPFATPVEQDIINTATAAGSLVVVASGNETNDNDVRLRYPATLDNVLCVGATDLNDRAADFSNYGINVHVWAPGSSILTTRSGNQYGNVDGTSFACPNVSGVAALVRSLHPDWTPRQVWHQLRSTCDNVLGKSVALRPKYYGRVNAQRALSINSTLNQGSTLPGLEVMSITYNGTPTIQTNDTVTARIRIDNYLSNATNVSVTLTPSSNAVTFTRTQFVVPSIATKDSAFIDVKAVVKQPFYWMRDTSSILIAMSTGQYSNFQQLPLLINITGNTYTSLLADQSYTWVSASYRNALSNLWLLGLANGGSTVVRRIGSQEFSVNTNDQLTTIAAVSSTVGILGTNNSRVLRTTNAGSTWTPISIAGISGSGVASINFYDNSNGVLIPTSTANTWNCGISSDGGATWQRGGAMPTPVPNERPIANSAAYNGDNIWVGTTIGRIVRSSNRGAQWTSHGVTSGAVTNVAFSSAAVGVCLVRQTQSNSETARVFVTSDSGKTWRATGYTLGENSTLRSVSLFMPSNTTQVVATMNGSQVLTSLDTGRTWNALATTNGFTANCGTGFTQGSRATIFIAGTTVASLSFPIQQEQQRSLTVQPTVIFDSARVGSTPQIRTVQIRNTGTTEVAISLITIQPDTSSTLASEFTLTGASTTAISAGQTVLQSVRFTPLTPGNKRAIVTVRSNARDTVLLSVLTALATPDSATSVTDSDKRSTNSIEITSLYPNPTVDMLYANVYLSSAVLASCEIVDVRGSVVARLPEGMLPSGNSLMTVQTSALASGIYTLRIVGAKTLVTKQFSLIR